MWEAAGARPGRRLTALVAAGGLILIPTIWTLFPGLARWTGFEKGGVLGGWILLAGFAVYNTDKQARQLDQMMGETERRRLEQRRSVGALAIQALLDGRCPGLSHYAMDVLLPISKDPLRIQVTYSTVSPMDEAEWTEGKGAAGYAWSMDKYVIASGPKARDDTYALTAEEQKRYQHLDIVAATPIRNASGRRIGVLTAYGNDDDGYLRTDDAYKQQVILTEIIAGILVHMMGHDNDL